jgi:hypothetical protein
MTRGPQAGTSLCPNEASLERVLRTDCPAGAVNYEESGGVTGEGVLAPGVRAESHALACWRSTRRGPRRPTRAFPPHPPGRALRRRGPPRAELARATLPRPRRPDLDLHDERFGEPVEAELHLRRARRDPRPSTLIDATAEKGRRAVANLGTRVVDRGSIGRSTRASRMYRRLHLLPHLPASATASVISPQGA